VRFPRGRKAPEVESVPPVQSEASLEDAQMTSVGDRLGFLILVLLYVEGTF